jgi:endonuclease YncB( thermonuclease family)
VTPTKYLKDPEIKVLETGAREAHRGLWSDAGPTPPSYWRHPPKG